MFCIVLIVGSKATVAFVMVVTDLNNWAFWLVLAPPKDKSHFSSGMSVVNFTPAKRELPPKDIPLDAVSAITKSDSVPSRNFTVTVSPISISTPDGCEPSIASSNPLLLVLLPVTPPPLTNKLSANKISSVVEAPVIIISLP